MIRYQSETFEGDPKYISESRDIPREEWYECERKMDEVKEDARHKFINSYKSASNIKVKKGEK